MQQSTSAVRLAGETTKWRHRQKRFKVKQEASTADASSSFGLSDVEQWVSTASLADLVQANKAVADALQKFSHLIA